MEIDGKKSEPVADDSRREFLRGSSLLLAGAMPAGFARSQAAPSTPDSPLKLGLIGCGRRGIYLTCQLLSQNPAMQLTAVADMFGDRLQQAMRTVNSRHREQIAVTQRTRFCGWDSYRELMSTDVDVVILATCPGLRPLHFEEAVAAGKDVLVARPVATDIAGLHRFQRAFTSAQAQKLAVRVDLEHRANSTITQTLERIHEGLIGIPIFLRAYSISPILGSKSADGSGDEFSNQLRHWQHHAWTSGGGMLERHSDRLDLCNLVMQSLPVEAQGVGTAGTECSGFFDEQAHLSVEFRYPCGARLQSVWRRSQLPWGGSELLVHGSQGAADVLGGRILNRSGKVIWHASSSGEGLDPPLAETSESQFASDTAISTRPRFSTNLIEPAEDKVGQRAITGTLTAILGREAARRAQRLQLSDLLQSNQSFPMALPKAYC